MEGVKTYKSIEEMPINDQMDLLAREMIVYSIIYYDLDDNIISDKEYDTKARKLYKLCQENPDIIPQCQYKDILKDFVPDTGFDLKYKLSPEHKKYLEDLSCMILNHYKRDRLLMVGKEKK